MKHLIIGSGAMIAFKMIGILKYLKDFGHLDNLEEISTSSSGSIIASLYILNNGDIDKVVDIFVKTDIKKYTKINIKNFLKNYGFIDTGRILDLLDSVGLKDITFRELYYKNPIKLHIAVYDFLCDKTFYNSVDTTPDLDVSTSILRSISVPFLFCPMESRYLDGSTTEFSPSVPFIGKNDVFELRAEYVVKDTKPPNTLIQYLYIILSCLLSNRLRFDFFPRINVLMDFNIFDFSMSSEKKLELYSNGYQLSALKIPCLICTAEQDHQKHYTDVPEPSAEDPHQTPQCVVELDPDHQPESEVCYHREGTPEHMEQPIECQR